MDIENESSKSDSAFFSAILTFISFIAFGIIPLIASIISSSFFENSFISAGFWTLFTLFLLGWFKAQWTLQKPFLAGFQMAALGGASSCVAYLIAMFLSNINNG